MLLHNVVLGGEVSLPGRSPHAPLLPGNLLQAGVPRHIVACRYLDVSLQKPPSLCLPLSLEGNAAGWEECWLGVAGQVAVHKAALVRCLLLPCCCCCLLPLQHPCCLPASCLQPHCHPRFLCHTSAHATSVLGALQVPPNIFSTAHPHSNLTHASHHRHV